MRMLFQQNMKRYKSQSMVLNFLTFCLAMDSLIDRLIYTYFCFRHRILAHRCIYPQISQRYRLPSNLATEQLVETGFKELAVELEFLESKLAMGAVSGSSSPSPSLNYLCGGEPTIADFFVATILMQTEWVSFDLRLWPNMQSWFEKVQTQKYWHEIHEVHYDFIKQLKKMEDDGSPC